MSDEFSSDPFTILYKAIIQALLAHEPFNTLVRVNNRIDYVGLDQAQLKDSHSEVDLPLIELRPSGGEVRFLETNTSSFVSQNFEIRVVAKDQRLQREFFLVKWEVMRALGKAYRTITNLPFVTKFTLGDFVEDLDDPDTQKGPSGWSGVIEIFVEMRFNDEELQIQRR